MRVFKSTLGVAVVLATAVSLVNGQGASSYYAECDDSAGDVQLTTHEALAAFGGSAQKGCNDCGKGDCFGTCDLICYDCCRRGLIGGVEVAFLQPRFDLDLAFTTLEDIGGVDSIARNGEFDWDYEASPRIWAGFITPSGLATRFRYWEFDHNSAVATFTDPGGIDIFTPATPTFAGGVAGGSGPIGAGGAGDTITAISSLEMYAIDGEVGQRYTICGADVMVGGGVRYANYEQAYQGTITDAGGAFVGRSSVVQDVDGIGPTVFAEARRPVTCRLGLLANFRMSYLFGDFNYLALDQVPGFNDAAVINGDTTMRIYEIQIGADYQRELRSGALLFAKVAWEAQIWEGVARDGFVAGTEMGLSGGTIAVGIDR